MSGWRDNIYYQYYVQQPPITRTYMLGIVLISLPPLLNLVSPVVFLNFWDYTLRGEVWRPLTAFLFGGGGMSLLFGVFFAYQYSMQLETGKFGGSTADYAFYLLVSAVNIVVRHSPNHLLCRHERVCDTATTLISGWCLRTSKFQPW